MDIPHPDQFTSSTADRRCTNAAVGLLLAHALLVMWLGWRMTPSQDEVAHLPAGLAIWTWGRTDLYSVNPPLPRGLAAVPLQWTRHTQDWTPLEQDHGEIRREWALGAAFVKANGRRSWWLMTVARWASLPWTLLAGFVIWRWSRDIWGPGIALAPLALWCGSPNTIAYSALITPDIASVAGLLLAAWSFRQWLDDSTWPRTAFAGLALGIAVLTKSQWLILPPLWALLWLVQLFRQRGDAVRSSPLKFMALLLVGWNILCLGYGFRGVGQPLEQLSFHSRQLAGDDETPSNRWQGTLLGRCPNPVPRDFLAGIDLQIREFELGRPCYLLGTWRSLGVWWFYLFGLAVKVPVGTGLLALVGFLTIVFRPEERRRWTRFLPLVLPAVTVLLVASWQTTLHVYVRYVFCILPVTYFLSGSAWKWASEQQSRGPRVILASLLLFSALEMAASFPHLLGFFNGFAASAAHESPLLHDANVDWGQDLRLIEEWLIDNPDKTPVTLAWPGFYPTSWVSMPLTTTPVDRLTPGWHLISRTSLTAQHGGYRSYLNLTPVGTIGSTTVIYYVPADSASRTASPATHSE